LYNLERGSVAEVPWCIAPEAFHSACKVMLIATNPSANPVAGFPARATTVTGDSRPHNVGVKHGRTADATTSASSAGLVLESAAFEAGGATGEVVCPAVSHGAVPITGTNVGAGGESESRHGSATEITKV